MIRRAETKTIVDNAKERKWAKCVCHQTQFQICKADKWSKSSGIKVVARKRVAVAYGEKQFMQTGWKNEIVVSLKRAHAHGYPPVKN